MKIYRMTATFGKLEGQTLTLKPGLNVIEAPNEWGKSTWCAFLLTMLYGLDTRAKTTKTALADKEKYMPWSGSPMAGRIDLNWNGRDITIERSGKGRTPMGVFRAYETESGLAVPELTAANCGQILLGVEQSVFRRTGFIRQSDMPVTQDDALRRRLNALVTTGDETGDSDKLATALKELKNKCRYNRTGLLPQAEAQRQELEDRLAELDSLQQHSGKLKERLGEVKSWKRALENHRDALQYAAAEADAARVAEAREQRDRTEEKLSALEQICSRHPAREEVERKIRAIQTYLEDLADYQAGELGVASRPEPPVPPEQFRGMTLEQAKQMVESDRSRYDHLTGKKPYILLLLLGFLLLAGCIAAAVMKRFVICGGLGVLGLILLIVGIKKKNERQQEAEEIARKYGSSSPEAWTALLAGYEKEKLAYDQAILDYRVTRGDLDIQNTFLQKQRESLFGNQSPEKVLVIWQQMKKQWEEHDALRQTLSQMEKYLKMLQDMAKPAVRKPAMEDILAYSMGETEKMMAEAREEQQRLENRLSQYRGRMDTLGDPQELHAAIQAVGSRIRRLEETYEAATLALESLAQARQSLQRKFAPKISKRAQELLTQMTGGRYDRLTLSEDFSLLAAAEQEQTLHEVLWRSDGTADQLYFALRLAVAEELIPDAPMVLDDTFVRFDDDRLKAALEILQKESEQKQVILFTCQHREKELLY